MSILSLVRRFTADFVPPSFRSGRGELTQPGLRQPFWFVIMQVGLLLLFSFLAERCVLEPFTGVIAVAVAVVYVGYLLLEELSIIVGYIDTSLTDPLGLVASHWRTFGNAWIDARQAVFLAGKTDKEAAHRCLEDKCRRLVADFLAGQPHLSIMVCLLRKVATDVVLMVGCFSIIAVWVVKFEFSGYRGMLATITVTTCIAMSLTAASMTAAYVARLSGNNVQEAIRRSLEQLAMLG